jgi:hypothetical protein
MTKTFIIIGILLLLASCNKDTCQSSSAQESQSACSIPTSSDSGSAEIPPQDSPQADLPNEAMLFEATADLTNFDAKDSEKVDHAIEIIKKVIRTREFKDRVFNFTYNGQKSFVENNGLTNEQVYQKLLEGSEELVPGNDHEMDLELELYYSRRNTVGYTYANTVKIWMNTKYFDVYSPAEVAGNIFHEWSHKLGFGHSSRNSSSRASTVPYALGYLVEELGKKFE